MYGRYPDTLEIFINGDRFKIKITDWRVILLRKKAQNDPPAYALCPGAFRTYPAYPGKIVYYFLYDDGEFSNADYKFFLQTQLLANKLLSGVDGYVFYVEIFVEATLQKFGFLTKDLNTVSQYTNLIPETDLDDIIGIFMDYYAVKASDFRTSYNSEQIKASADFALISDDTHGVWTIWRTENYCWDLLIENLEKFCGIYSTELKIYG